MKSTRFTVVEDDDLMIDLEYNDQFFILHLPVFKATKETFLRLKVKLEELAEFAETIGYTGVYTGIQPDNQTMKKLMKMLSAKHIGSDQGFDVYQYQGET